VIHIYGWKTLVSAPLLVLICVLVGLYIVRIDPLLRRTELPAAGTFD